MEKQRTLTPKEAWDDFLEYAKDQGLKLGNNVSMAKRDAGGYRNRTLGVRRIEKILNEYCPGRYEFRGVFILHDRK